MVLTALAMESIPAFRTTSKEPVLFRYKFTPGELVGIQADMDININMNSQNIPIKMFFTAEYRVSSVNSKGDAVAVIKINRFTMTSSTPSGDITIDSTQSFPANPQLRAFSELLNTSFPVTVSNRGELIDMDKSVFNKIINSGIDAALGKQLEDTINQISRSSFIQLPEKPIVAGAVYDAGAITTNSQGIVISCPVRYRIKSISGDKKQAVLLPESSCAITSSPNTIKALMNASNFTGWILFDLEKGNIIRSNGSSLLDMILSSGDFSLNMKTRTNIRYKTLF